MSLQSTTWQTVGPYFRIGLDYLNTNDMVPPGTIGERVTVKGQMFDGNGVPIPDAVIEIWQANAAGEYGGTIKCSESPHGKFSGFGRCSTDEDGRFSITTVRPGSVSGLDGAMQSPHLAVRLMMRGLLKGLVTRMYFPSETLDADPILNLVPDERRATLIATSSPDDESTFSWNIEMQGDRETVFFDC